MNSNKFTQLHVYIIGGVLMLLVGVGLFFTLIKPVEDENKNLETSIQGTEGTQVPIDSKPFTPTDPWDSQKKGAEEKLQEATQRQKRKAAELAVIENRKQLPAPRQIDIGDGSQAHLLNYTMPRWVNLPQYVVQMMNSYALSTAAKHHITKLKTTFKAPAPTVDIALIPKQIIAWNMGPIEVTGNFNDVMQWAEDWNNAPLLVAVDGLKCSVAGRGGKITATGNLTVYVFPTGKAVTNPAAAPVGGPTGAPTGGAGYPGASGSAGAPGAPYPGGGGAPRAGGGNGAK
jgi:hypothetical protein